MLPVKYATVDKVSFPLLKTAAFVLAFAPLICAQEVTYFPYLQLGDSGPLGATDQVVVAWQTNEASPNPRASYKVEFGATTRYGATAAPTSRVVDNYLAADPALPAIPSSYGPHINYVAILSGLRFDTAYFYRVTGPGVPASGFVASFHTRKKSSAFSFAVEGDEGSFPPVPNSHPPQMANYEARIAHLIYNAGAIPLPDSSSRPPAEFVLNTGDNVYTMGSEGSYRDFFFPVFNNDTDSNETGAPLIRSMLYFIAVGNHDLGFDGVSANLLADNAAPRFSGNLQGGSALAFFNNYYYPQNGPAGFDIQSTRNGETATPNGLHFAYQGKTYQSPAAIEAFRASTNADTGNGPKRQIDHASNYSFDYGNAHFLFLDANPHLFNGILSSGNATSAPPSFPPYPSELAKWVIDDLDSSKQLWKIAVFHQPSFSSGDATVLNSQMRAVTQLLEDHGVSIVFNGHEHNYQRSLPIRATAGTAVNIDQVFDGSTHTVPDGVLYIVEGAGGNRDFDGNLPPPRGSGPGVDQDDSATGTYTPMAGLTVPQGPADWLDTNLTNREMVAHFPNAGTRPKITAKFKSKVFSFGHVVVNDNKLTLYQISEPLLPSSSASAGTPAPYGTDFAGHPLNDPIPDTLLDGTTGALLSAPATGRSALLDKFTVTKPDVRASVSARLSAPLVAIPGGEIVYSVVVNNHSSIALNGAQVRLTVQGVDIVSTLGRLAPGTTRTVQMKTSVPASLSQVRAAAALVSGTALPVRANATITKIVSAKK
ncbi:MAG TPA: metallophosphoesterase family protein [Bryobacteraceae bacterium]|nr:metallophosphoesterase family protein [Bryobacteraceae bacterium]